MSLQRALAQILEHVDTARWDRPAELLRLIATLQDGPNPVPLGRALLEATGRSPRQAKYDHEVLVRLAERDRILMRWRGEGRRPDSWALASIEKWRHVPWITPRRDVLRAFSSPVPDEAVALWAKRAAQVVELGTDTPLLDALAKAGLSVNLRATTPRHMSTTPRDAGETPAGYGHNATGSADSLHAYKGSLTPFENPHSLEGGREGISEAEEQAGRRFKEALEAKLATPTWGKLAVQVVTFGAARADRIDQLLGLVATIPPDVKRILGALDYLAGAMTATPRSSASGRPDCRACGGSGWVDLPDGTVARCDHSQGPDTPPA